MRITHNAIVENVIANVQRRIGSLSAAQQRLSSGIDVEKPSDDPNAAADILELNRRLSRSAQYTRNIEGSLATLRMAEDAVGGISDLLVTVRARAVEGANGGLGAEERRAIAHEVNQSTLEILRVVNQRYGNVYLFGGSETRHAPYTSESEDGWVTQVNPQFETPPAQIEQIVGDGERMQSSIGAGDVLNLGDGENLFDILIDLRTALTENDDEAVGDALPRLDAALEQLHSLRAMIGSRIGSAQTTLERLSSQRITMTARLAETQDVEIAEAVTHFNVERTAYELALRTAAQVIQPSLINFLRI